VSIPGIEIETKSNNQGAPSSVVPPQSDTPTANSSQETKDNTGSKSNVTGTGTPSASQPVAKGPLVKTLTTKVFFDMGSHQVIGKNLEAVRALAPVIAGLGKSITIQITGYAQPTPGSEATDGALSERRAAQVSKILRAAGVTTKIVYTGAGRAALNIPSSRYVEIVAANR
jgi:outer membrane protein OmpA-like peptidoglycan-associated protein